MAVDSATSIGGFDTAKPADSDLKAEGAANLRHIKNILKTDFPNVTGVVSATHTQLSYVTGVTSAIQTQLDAKAPLASPTLTGTPAAPTAAAGTNTTQIATTAHVFAERANTATLTNKTLTSPVINSPTGITKGNVGLGNVDNTSDAGKPVSTAQQAALDLKANLASPTFTGTPAAPTATAGTSTTQIATTAFVGAAAFSAALPSQTGNSGKFVTTDGSNASWAVPTTAAITASTDKNYVTDAQLTLLGNTSGTNTGDLTAASQAEMEAGTEAGLLAMSPLRVAQAIAALAGEAGAMLLVSSATASSSATIEFTGLAAGYDYEVHIDGLRPATAGQLQLRVSEDNGSTFKSGGSDYSSVSGIWHGTASTTQSGAANGSEIGLSTGGRSLNINSPNQYSAVVKIFNPGDTANNKNVQGSCTYETESDGFAASFFTGKYKGTTNAINAIRFFMPSGNIAVGVFRLYKIARS